MLIKNEVQRNYFANILTMFLSIITNSTKCRIISLTEAYSYGLSATAQTLENIRVDQDGERRFEPVSVIGDVGDEGGDFIFIRRD